MTRRKITRANVRGFSRHQPQTLWGGQTLWGAEGLWGFHRESIGRTRTISWLDSGTKWMPDPGSVWPLGNAVLGLCVYPQFGMRSGYRDRFQRVRDTFRRILSLEPGPWTLGIERPFRLIFFKHLPLCCSSTDTAQHNG